MIGTARTFIEAIERRVEYFARLGPYAFTRAADALRAEANPLPHETMGVCLMRLAEQGSIDAVAILIVGGCPSEMSTKAALAIVQRSQDLVDDLILTELVRMAEEFAEAEVAAGRMFVTEDPYTGRKLYSKTKPDDGAQS